MPLILTDTASLVVNDYLVRKPLRNRVTVEYVEPPVETQEVQQEEPLVETIKAQVVQINPKKAVSSYRQDLLTSTK